MDGMNLPAVRGKDITLRIFRSPFHNRDVQEITVPCEEGLTLAALRERFLPVSPDINFSVSMNMAIIRPEHYPRA